MDWEIVEGNGRFIIQKKDNLYCIYDSEGKYILDYTFTEDIGVAEKMLENLSE